MRFRLRGTQREFRFEDWQWPNLLRIATRFGWIPAGTIPPPRARANQMRGGVGYDVRLGQRVSDDDASNLAVALQTALSQLSDEELLAIECPESTNWGMASYQPDLEGLSESKQIDFRWLDRSSPCKELVGWRACLQEFITFCRDGAFTIH